MTGNGSRIRGDQQWQSFCEKRGFKPFPIDEQSIDLDSGLIESLMDAFRNNAYDRSMTLVIASSDDPAVDKEVVDGRHRIVAAYRLFKKGIPVKMPPIVQEDIPDVATLNCRIAHYVQMSRSKHPILAKRIVEHRIRDVIESQIDKYGDKLPDKIVRMGFSSVTIVNKLLDEVKEKRQKKRPGQKQLKASNSALQYDFGGSESWGVSKRYPNEPIQAGIQDKMDEIVAFRPCPCGCKPPKKLAIVNGLDGSLRDIKLAAEEEAMSK